jgi:hypothetical protein
MKTPFTRAYLSYNRLEWWFGHLATALAARIETVTCPMGRFSQPGHDVETRIEPLLEGGDHAFYLGSLDQLFPGIADLPMPSAVWIDVTPSRTPAPPPGLRIFDLVFTAQKDSIPMLERAGHRVEWLPFAVDTTLRNDPTVERIYDVGFVGSLDQPATRDERRAVLPRLERRYRLNDYRTPAFGDAMMRTYNQSRIAVNIPVPGGFSMRAFEAMAAGALFLTRHTDGGQDDLFVDGVHLVIYDTFDDLIDKIDYYLTHDAERAAIARAGREEVLRHHTYGHRAAQILETMATAAPRRQRDRATDMAAYAAFYDYIGRPDLLALMACDAGVPLSTRLRLLRRATLKFGRRVLDRRKARDAGRPTAS